MSGHTYDVTCKFLIKEQIIKIEDNYNNGKLNKGDNSFIENLISRPENKEDKKGYEIDYKAE